MSIENTSRKEFLASLVTTGLVLAGCSDKKSPFELAAEENTKKKAR